MNYSSPGLLLSKSIDGFSLMEGLVRSSATSVIPKLMTIQSFRADQKGVKVRRLDRIEDEKNRGHEALIRMCKALFAPS
jgi:hypothetical protein